MDFGVLGLDQGLGVSLSSSSSSSSFSEAGFVSHISSSNSDPETKHRTLYGSGFCNKQERSEGTVLDDFWRSSKLSKTSSDADFLNSKAMFQRKNTNFPRSTSSSATLSFLDNTTDHHQMLSFSSPKPAESFLVDHKSSQIPTSPNYFLNALSTYNCRSIAGFNSGCLVNGGNYDMHGMKAGPFTLSQWIELEQQALIYKYITANIPIPSNLLTPIRRAFDSVAFSSFPHGLLRPNTALGWGAFHLGFSNNTDPEPGRCRRTDGKKWRCSRDAVADQKYCERHINRGRHRSRKPVEGQTGHSLAGARNAAATTTTTTSASSFSIALPRGGVASNAPSPTPNSSSASTNMNRSNQFGHVDSETQNTLRHFIDIDWPDKTAKESNNNNVSQWPESDRTQLSISISSMSSSDANLEQNTASHVDNHHHHHQRQALNLIPMSWETSLGGPLGEVLHHTNNNNNNNNADSGDCKRPFSSSSSSVLNLMTEGWDSSPPMGSSPTGVLQKTAFGSLSNSSAGSSPRAGNFNKDLLT